MTETYKIADCNIEIRSIHRNVHTLCRDYISSLPPDFTVETTRNDITYERERSENGSFSDGYLETLAVYRKIADRMLEWDTVLFHGSCIAVDGEAYLFTAKSGTGKSTHTRLWRELLGSRAVMVNDDKPLIRITESGAVVYGTPWNGKHGLGENIAVPLRAVCVLHRSVENRIEPAEAKSVLPILLQQTHRPAEPRAMERMLALTDRLAASVRLYRLGCNMDPEAAEIAYKGMKP